MEKNILPYIFRYLAITKIKKLSYIFLIICFIPSMFWQANAQTFNANTCGTEKQMEIMYKHNADALLESNILRKKISTLKKSKAEPYVIPVVFHVFGTEFNDGTTVTIDIVKDALRRTNEDFQGLNDDYTTIDAPFDAIKQPLDITFKLAQLDPNGNPTTGVLFYNEASGMGNYSSPIVSRVAWDNLKYCNIYITRDLYGDGDHYNAGITWLPNTGMTNENIAGIVYNGSYLGDNTNENFRSVLTHEFGHYLDLLHTFNKRVCSDDPEEGDGVADTPSHKKSSSRTACAVIHNCLQQEINNENFMDYTDCYKMFTQGQVKRMNNALQNSPARNTLWTNANIQATGLSSDLGSRVVTNTNDDPTGLPTISGTPTQGETLTAGTDDIRDADGLGSFSYQWQAGTDDISGATDTTFVLTQAQVGQMITVTVSYTDGGNHPETLTSVPTNVVTNVNDAPTITGTPPATIAEDDAYTFTPGGGDVDAGDTPVYSLSNHPDWLMVDTATGTLSGTPTNADVGTTTGIVLTITSGGQTDTLTFSIEVTNVNDAPTITGTPPASIAEDSAYSFTPGGGDIDAGDTPVYSLSNHPDWLMVNDATGALSGTPTNADVGTTTGIVLTITAGGQTDTLTFSIEVTNVNDAPTITGTPPASIAEDDAYTFTPGGGDVDAGDTPVYSLSNNPDWLSVNDATGELSGTPTNADVGTRSDIVLTITAGGQTDTLTFSIEVTNVNDAPTITGTPPASIAEDSAYSFTPGGGDVDADDTPVYSLSNHPDWLMVDTATGTLSGTPTNADVGVRSDIVLTITSGGQTDTLTFSIEVTNVNDAPTITGTPPDMVAEDTAYTFTPGGGDVDANDTPTYTLSNNPDWLSVNDATGTLSGTPANDDVGTHSDIVLTITSGGETAALTFSIEVTNVNDAPTITGTPPATIAEDSAYSFTPGGGDVDAGDTLVYSLSDNPTWLMVNADTGTLSGTPANDDVGTHSDIVLTITSGGETAALTFSIEVTNVNDAPTITGTPPASIAEDSAYSFTPGGGDVDAGDTPVYSLSDNPTWLMVNADAGELSGTPTNADVGEHSDIVLTITAGGATAALTFSIEVTNTNDAPTITGTPPDMVAEDSAYSFTPGGGDVDAHDTPSYTLSNNPSWLMVNDATGTLSGTPTNADVSENRDIVLTITSGEETATLTFSIEVTNTNDAPTITGTPPATVAEDSAYSFTPEGGDIDANDTPLYSLSNNPDWLSVDTATGTLSGTPTNADVGTHSDIVLTITSGGETATLTFDIEVTNTNDAPTITGTPPATIAEDDAYSFTPGGGDIDAGDTPSYSLSNNPDWLMVNTATGALSGTPTNAHVGTTTGIVVSVSDGIAGAVSLPAFSITVTNTNDAPTGLPTITGTLTQGATLTAVTAAISDADGLGTFSYQWQADTDAISGATDTSLELTQAEVGQTITVKVSYTDGGSTAESLTSVATDVVTNTNDAPTGLPIIEGTSTQGQTLTAVTDDIADADGLGSFSYQWQAGTDAISSATSNTFVLTQDQVGQTITVKVSYTDGGSTAESLTSAPTNAVTNTNDAPTGLPTITGTPTQGETLTAVTSTIDDADGVGSFSYQWQADTVDISGADEATFILTQTQVGQTITVTVSYTDGGNHPETLASAATNAVANTNDAPTGLPTISGTPTQGETLTAGTDAIADADGLGSFSYQWQAGTVDISGATDTSLELTQAEVGKTITLTVSYTDGGDTRETLTSVPTNVVTDVNDAPTITGATTFTIAENAGDGAMVGIIIGADVDAGTTLTYSIIAGNTNDAFAIGSATGAITVNGENKLDYETTPSYSLTVSVSDGDLAGTATVTITVTDIEEMVTFTVTVSVVDTGSGLIAEPISDLVVSQIPENTAYTATPATAGATPIGAVTWALSGDDATAFTIDATSGMVRMIGRDFEAPVDADNNNVYLATIIATDSASNVANIDIAITVTNTNEAPAISGTTTFTIAENAGDGAMVGIITGADVDAGTTLTYSIIAGNTNDAFTIGSATGAITVNGDNKLDYETTPSYSLMVTVSDSSLEATATVTINVEDVNEAPTITGTPPATVAEDSAYSFTPEGGDIDANDTPSYALSNHPTWLIVNDATGTLSGTPTNTDVGVRSDIVLTITSGDETATLTFSIEVTNTNDTPTITGIPDTTIAQDADYLFAPVGADIDVGDTLEYAITNKPGWAGFSTTTGTLSGTPTNAHVGITEDIVISVSDGIAEAVSLPTFSITVTNTNDSPTITGTTMFTIAENAGDGAMVGTIIGADVDTGTTLTYSIIAGNTNDAFTIDSASGDITVHGDNKLDHETTPSYSLTVSVSDSSLEATATVTINVEDVNEAPTITGTPPDMVAEDDACSFTPGGGDVDANDTPVYSLSNHPNWLSVNDATGTLSGTPTNADVGVRRDIVLTITSGGQTDTLTFSIEVTNTNDAPKGEITIKGITIVAETLEAITTDIIDDDGLTNVEYSYQWREGETSISDATEKIFLLTEEQVGKTISVKVNYTDDRGANEEMISSQTDIITSTSLGNEDFEIAYFIIYPNPAKDILNITAPEKADYKLLSIRGNIIKKGTFTKGKNYINISSLARGVYLLKATSIN